MMSHLLAVRKGEDVMSTKTGNMRRAILSGVVGAAIVGWFAASARADVASDQPGAILIYPKIVVDTSGIFGPPTDTEIQLTNTSDSIISTRCFLVNATSYCSNSPTTPCTAETEASPNPSDHHCPPGGVCLPRWDKTDFNLTLTKRQPVSWKASDGRSPFPCDEQGSSCFGGQTNAGSVALGTQTDPFFGELKCVEVDKNGFAPTAGSNPANHEAGDLKGEATIVSVTRGEVDHVDARKYNAVAVQACNPSVTPGCVAPGTTGDTLVLGGPSPEYNSCPNILILNHLFDGADVSTHQGNIPSSHVTTDLTLVPCSEDFATPNVSMNAITLQFLVFNEFEQRFSTSTNFTCFTEVKLSDIDTRPGPFGDSSSIFNVAVSGTLSGQTRIRSVEGATTANGVLGVSEEFWDCGSGPNGICTAAANLHFTGNRTDKPDQVLLGPNNP
jgi:hypothetical protein